MGEASGRPEQRLRVVTWNVWFDPFERARRYRALWAELDRLAPDVICLQEVIPEHLHRAELRVRRERGEWLSNTHVFGYDVLMVARSQPRTSERVPLRSMMGRELLLARLDLDPPLTIGTVHLESMKGMTDFRVIQLQTITEQLARDGDALLVGDMNFAPDSKPETEVLDGWLDLWPALHGDDPGFTVDSQVNTMRGDARGELRKRIDRAFLRGMGWRAVSIERLGLEPLASDPPTWTSDHFGLCVELVSTST